MYLGSLCRRMGRLIFLCPTTLGLIDSFVHLGSCWRPLLDVPATSLTVVNVNNVTFCGYLYLRCLLRPVLAPA